LYPVAKWPVKIDITSRDYIGWGDS